MGTAPTTRPSLLVRIRDAGDKEAWRRFVEVYAPLVYGFARRRGLQDADAADVTQDVCQAVAAAVQRDCARLFSGSRCVWSGQVAPAEAAGRMCAQSSP